MLKLRDPVTGTGTHCVWHHGFVRLAFGKVSVAFARWLLSQYGLEQYGASLPSKLSAQVYVGSYGILTLVI